MVVRTSVSANCRSLLSGLRDKASDNHESSIPCYDYDTKQNGEYLGGAVGLDDAAACNRATDCERAKNKALPQQALGQLLGVSQGAGGQWEIAKTSPNLETLRILCEVLGVTCEWLMTGVEAPEQQTAQSIEEQDFLIDCRMLPAEDRKKVALLMHKLVSP